MEANGAKSLEGQNIPSWMAVDKDERDKLARDAMNKDPVTNRIHALKLNKDFRKMVEDTFSEGKTEDPDRKAALVKLHTELTATNVAVNTQEKELFDATQSILKRDEVGATVDVNPSKDEVIKFMTPYNKFTEELNKHPQVYNKSQSLPKMLASLPIGTNIELNMSAREVQNTLFKRDTGYPPESTRYPGWIPLVEASRPIELLDIIRTSRTSQMQVKYIEEKTIDNKAAYIAEGNKYPESGLALEEKSLDVYKVGTTLPVTDEQLADEEQAESYINERMPWFLRQMVNKQLYEGRGKANTEWEGVLNMANAGDMDLTFNSSKKAENPKLIDDAYRLQSKSYTDSWIFPNLYLLAEAAWTEIVLDRTNNAGYLLGPPGSAVVPMLWGLPVTRSPSLSLTNGKIAMITGNFDVAVELVIRMGMEIAVGQPDDDFLRDRRTYKVRMRGLVLPRRPQSIVRGKDVEA